jgi:adenosylmethionine-8-amino-7-oxononanoate aminotransferase
MTEVIDLDAVWEMDRGHFVHPYADLERFRANGSRIMAKADGIHVTDLEGRQFLDAIAGLWCVNVGHGREKIVEAMAHQARTLEYYNPFGATSNVPAARLAAKLAELAPGDLDRVFFSTGGSTANEMAVQIAHHYFNRTGRPEKKKIISRLRAYHGGTYVASTLSGIAAAQVNFDRIEGLVSHVSAADLYRKPDHLSEAEYCDFLIQELENRIVQVGPERVAAFIAEPVMGAGGVLVAPQGYHARALEVCHRYDVLYIADEVVTGFGRLGHMFASLDEFGMQPDIICAAKGISSGYVPLGATIISERIYAAIEPAAANRALTRGFTYSGHAVACAAALANIEIIEDEQLCANVLEVGPSFHASAQSLLNNAIVGDVRGRGFMLGVELVSNKEQKLSFPADVNIAEHVAEACLAHGVIVRPVGNVLVASPPLIMTEDQGRTIVAALQQAIDDVSRKL